jgi:phosphatidylcholine synthase
LAFFLLFIATIIDYTDGTLARLVGVNRNLPIIDGDKIDTAVDFVTNIMTPVLILTNRGLLPWPMWFWVSAILLPSLYRFSNLNPVRVEGFFWGVPPIWIFPAFYIYECNLREPVVAILITAYAALCFVPFGYLHVARFPKALILNGAALLGWWIIYLIVTQRIKPLGPLLLTVSLICLGFYFASSCFFYLRFRRGRLEPTSEKMRS